MGMQERLLLAADTAGQVGPHRPPAAQAHPRAASMLTRALHPESKLHPVDGSNSLPHGGEKAAGVGNR